jgi:REP element-mobilizing transposase RayT
MPRKARIDAYGALQHITVRGIERKRIFYDDVDRDNFVAWLTAILPECKVRCYAWALIPNLLQLLFRAVMVATAVFLKSLQSILCQQNSILLEPVCFEFEFTSWTSLK